MLRPVDSGLKMIQVVERCGDYPQLGARISPIKASEEPTAGIEVRGHLWRWMQSHGCIQPLQQANFKILENGNLANILTRRKLERAARLLQGLDEPVTIKDHCRPYLEYDCHHQGSTQTCLTSMRR